MSQYEILSKDKHRELRVKTGYGKALGDAIMYVMTYPMEFRDIQSCYPILFTKDPNSGGFFAVALLGFETDENLFLKNEDWDAYYVPDLIERQPFLVATGGAADNPSPAVSIDLEHPRVSRDEGEALFDSEGEVTEFLQGKISLLEKLHRGLQHGSGFIEALLKHELLDQITLDITFNDGSKKSLQGFYTIAEERLYQAKGEVLEALNQAGYLQPAFMAIASLSSMRGIIERRNRALAG